MRFQPPEHNEFITNAGTNCDLSWLKTAVAMIEKNQSVHARGGDGQTALHFASTIEIARQQCPMGHLKFDTK